jgi:glutamate racemase
VGRAVETSGPIGIFDSGVGGLSVALEIRRELPAEDLLYAADSAHAPYGDKPAPYIRDRALLIAGRLVEQNAKALVVACNTATALAVDALRGRWSMPIVAVEPAVKPAAVTTKSGVVGVLATAQTIASARFERLADVFGGGATILAQPCPGLVERIESGEVATAETRALVERYVRPLVEKGADTLVLGCTHYPFVRALIESVAGPDVVVIDPSAAVARELRRRLSDAGLLRGNAMPGVIRFTTSGVPGQIKAVLEALGIDAGEIEALGV